MSIITNTPFTTLFQPQPPMDMVNQFYEAVSDAIALYEHLLSVDVSRALELMHTYIDGFIVLLSHQYKQAHNIRYVLMYNVTSDTCSIHPWDNDPYTQQICDMIDQKIKNYIP